MIRALKDVEIRYVEKGGMRRKRAKVQGNVAFSEQTGFWTRWEGMQRTRGGIVQDVKQHQVTKDLKPGTTWHEAALPQLPF